VRAGSATGGPEVDERSVPLVAQPAAMTTMSAKPTAVVRIGNFR
jgi:hypothetical protein